MVTSGPTASRVRRAGAGDAAALAHGHVSNISTDLRRRGRGHARACLDALLAWFREETDVRVINLNATRRGSGLYRSAGFEAPHYPALQLIMDRQVPRGGDRPPTIDSVGGRANGVV
jgi:ribosomal protein S18 acetylase RimI-like enzyme